jgi:hypothetical protein
VVGYHQNSNGGYDRGFIESNGSFTTINDPNGTHGTVVFGINESGQVLGESFGATTTNSFVYANNAFATLSAPGAIQGTYGYGITMPGK